MLRFSKRLFIVNLLGALFYISCLMQWLWSLLPFLPGIIRFTEALQTPTDAAPDPITPIVTSPPSPLMTIFGVIVVVVVIGIVIYLLVKTPTAIGKTGQKLTTGTSNYIVPVVSQHQKLTPKKRRQLTARVITSVKIALTILPIILAACTHFIATDLSLDIIILAAGILCVGSLMTLGLQLLLVKALRVTPEKVW